jgi:hypothetical protein
LARKEVTEGDDVEPLWFGLRAEGADQRVVKSESYKISLVAGDRHWEEQWSESEPNALVRFKTYPPKSNVRIEYTYAGTHKILGPAN